MSLVVSELQLLVDERNLTRLLYRYGHALDGEWRFRDRRIVPEAEAARQ
jgi:hypothetical protein